MTMQLGLGFDAREVPAVRINKHNVFSATIHSTMYNVNLVHEGLNHLRIIEWF